MTHRQFGAWQLWLEEQWNKPDRHDYYMMQVHQGNIRGKGGKPPALEKMKIPFKFVVKNEVAMPVGMSDEERRAAATKISQARWLQCMTLKPKIV